MEETFFFGEDDLFGPPVVGGSGERQVLPDHWGKIVVNPNFEDDSDPEALNDGASKPLVLYRLRKLYENPHILKEIFELITGRRLFFSDLESLNDIFEGEPALEGDLQPLPRETQRQLYVKVATAIIQAKSPPQEIVEYWRNTSRPIPGRLIQPWVADLAATAKCAEIARAHHAQLEEILRQARSSVRVACLRNTLPNTAKAWGHYGDGGSGICFEIEDMYSYPFFSTYTPKDVEYQPDRPELSRADLAAASSYLALARKYHLTNFSLDSRRSPLIVAIRKFALTKHDDWSDEAETRVLDIACGNKGYRECKGLRLKRIIFGPKVREMDIQSFRESLEKMSIGVPFARTVKDSRSYELSIVDL